MLLSMLVGCTFATKPVQPAGFSPTAPVSPVTLIYPGPESQTEPATKAASTSFGSTDSQFAQQHLDSPARFVQTGIASWYGPGFHGKRTAHGEIYNQYALTAAHRSLPLGTRVKVTNRKSGQAVEVRINDRGPFADDRIIDLSFAAAKKIGVYTPGTAPVRVEVLSAPAPLLSVLHAVQVGSYTDPDRAAAVKQALTPRFSPVYISPLSSGQLRYYQVRLGPFTERADAEHHARSVIQAGLHGIVVEEDERWAE